MKSMDNNVLLMNGFRRTRNMCLGEETIFPKS